MDVISYGFAVLVFSGGLMGYIKVGECPFSPALSVLISFPWKFMAGINWKCALFPPQPQEA